MGLPDENFAYLLSAYLLSVDKTPKQGFPMEEIRASVDTLLLESVTMR
jgi:hypothetical protein